MNKRFLLIAAVAAIVWGIGLLTVFTYDEFGLWLSFGMSVGGVGFAMYNYLTWIDKLMRGEVSFDMMGMMNGLPR